MRTIFISILTGAIVSGCALADFGSDKTKPFDFGGVFEETYAGEVDRRVVPKRADGPPNIVLIIADDLGWPYLGFLGDRNVITPNMDILGEGGVVFETSHSTSNHCRPTLQSLITGLYPVQYEQRAHRIAENDLQTMAVPAQINTPRERDLLLRQLETEAIEQFETLPRLLAEQGYVSHQSGKWWEQSYAHGGFTHGMTESWDWQDAANLGDRWFFTFMGGRGNKIGRETMEPVTNFIRENSDKPFFVWYGPALPHTPLNAPDKFYKYYEDREDLSESAKLYYANIAWFDWGVGQLIDTLREERLIDNTLIVYINDNGWEQPSDAEYVDNHINFANGGPRGKGSFFETAFRTPVIFYWKDRIHAARDKKTLISAIDVMPTLLEYAGAKRPDGLPGHSLKSLIEQASNTLPRDFLIGRMTQHRAGTDFRGNPDNSTEDHMGAALSGYYRRDERWHFVWLPETNETALYDLEKDPQQQIDFSSSYPVMIKQFKDDITAWRSTYERE